MKLIYALETEMLLLMVTSHSKFLMSTHIVSMKVARYHAKACTNNRGDMAIERIYFHGLCCSLAWCIALV